MEHVAFLPSSKLEGTSQICSGAKTKPMTFCLNRNLFSDLRFRYFREYPFHTIIPMFVASDAAQNNLSHLPIISLSLVISYLMNNRIPCS